MALEFPPDLLPPPPGPPDFLPPPPPPPAADETPTSVRGSCCSMIWRVSPAFMLSFLCPNASTNVSCLMSLNSLHFWRFSCLFMIIRSIAYLLYHRDQHRCRCLQSSPRELDQATQTGVKVRILCIPLWPPSVLSFLIVKKTSLSQK